MIATENGVIFILTNNTDNGCKRDGEYEKRDDKSLGNQSTTKSRRNLSQTVFGGQLKMTMRENILKLMSSNISVYRIAKEAELPENTVRRLRNGEANLDNIRFSLAEKLNQYYLEVIKMNIVIVGGEKLELDVLADYMDDELRESVNDEKFADNQEYIELYIERAREEDPEFLNVLASEFGVNV